MRKIKKGYCHYNPKRKTADCVYCNLVNYGLDCRNNPISEPVPDDYLCDPLLDVIRQLPESALRGLAKVYDEQIKKRG